MAPYKELLKHIIHEARMKILPKKLIVIMEMKAQTTTQEYDYLKIYQL